MADTFACTGKNCPFMRDVKRCTAPHCENRTPPTNADRIRAMSDEELAKKIHGLEFDVYTRSSTVHSTECWIDWLKSPAEEG